MKRCTLFLIMIVATIGLKAQQSSFAVDVVMSSPRAGTMTLTVFDSDNPASPRVMTSKRGKTNFLFSGSVKKPVYAELRHSSIQKPLGFFIENSAINITFLVDNPDSSPIKGSRSNSQYRYLLEQCADEYDRISCISRYVEENPSSDFAPCLIYKNLLEEISLQQLQHLYGLITEPARHTVHYTLLGSYLQKLTRLAEGAPLPSFTFFDDNAKKTLSDTLLADSSMHLILFGAKWCQQCSRINEELRNNYNNLKTITINIDRDPQGWDAPCLDILSIDHIPFMILVDADRHIVARDLRIWELERLLRSSKQ